VDTKNKTRHYCAVVNNRYGSTVIYAVRLAFLVMATFLVFGVKYRL